MAYVSETGTPGMHREEPWYYRVSWGGIFAGTLVALGSQLLLMLLGMGIGFGVIGPVTEEGFGGIGTGSGIYILLASLVSLFLGGWVCAKISSISDKFKSGLHGLVVWALFTFTAFYLVTTAAGGLISSFAGIISRNAAIISGEIPGITPEMAQGALDTASRASLWGFFALLLTAVAAVLGGWVGHHKEEEGRAGRYREKETSTRVEAEVTEGRERGGRRAA